MTLSPFLIYLWGQADKLVSIFGGVAGIALLIGGILTIVTSLMPATEFISEEQYKKIRKLGLASLTIGGFFISAYVVTPESKTIATMVVLPAIVNSQPIQKDLPDIYNLAVDTLKKKIVGEPEKK